MEDRDFNELAGRIEGVARVVLGLAAELEISQVVDGPHFTRNLRGCIKPDADSQAHLHVAARTVMELAKTLDDARGWRRFRATAGLARK